MNKELTIISFIGLSLTVISGAWVLLGMGFVIFGAINQSVYIMTLAMFPIIPGTILTEVGRKRDSE